MNIRDRMQAIRHSRKKVRITVAPEKPVRPPLMVNAIIESAQLSQDVSGYGLQSFAGRRDLNLSVRILASDTRAYHAFWNNLHPQHDGVVKLWIQPREAK
jgi:hypothetical protein